jgi:hypothetical protein
MPFDKGDLVEDVIKELTPLFEDPETTDRDLVEHASRLVKSMQARLKKDKILDRIVVLEDRIAVLDKEIAAIEYEKAEMLRLEVLPLSKEIIKSKLKNKESK